MNSPSPIYIRQAGVPLPTEVALVYRPLNSPILVVEARFGEDGRLKCTSPLSGLSLYWPVAIAKLEIAQQSRRMAEVRSRAIITFDDPGQAAVRLAWESAGSAKPCSSTLGIEPLLRLGAGLIQRDRPREAVACFDLALSLAADSVAAHYGAAVAAGMSGDTKSRIEHYQRVVTLSPQFYEARLNLAGAQRFANQLSASAETLDGILADSPPLPTQQRVYDALVSVYDQNKNRRAAAKTKRSLVTTEAEIRELDPALVNEAVIAFDTRDLAAREEEIGDYESAARDFADALRRSTVATVSEAVRFEAAMGSIRSTGKLGRAEPARKACADWKLRLTTAGGELENLHWGGRTIAEARWQFSCGDPAQAFLLLQEGIKHRPTSDVPYLLMEQFYRARGQSDLGDKAHALAQKVRTEHDRAILGALLDEAVDLAKRGGAQRFP